MVLAEGERRSDSGSVLPGLADGYVMAVALLVIGWVLAFGAEFHHVGERPETFLAALLHPLSDLAVLGALLPVLTAAWRRVLVPYLALLALTLADSLGVGWRIYGRPPGRPRAAGDGRGRVPARPRPLGGEHRRPLRPAARAHPERGPRRRRRAARAPARACAGHRSPVPARPPSSPPFAVVIAAFVVIVNGLASAPASGLALVIAGGAAVLVVGVRILMLVRENGVAVRMWREASNSLRELADRTGDMVLICDLDGTISYASPLVSGFSYSPEALVGKGLSEFVHPEDIGAARAAVAAVVGLPEEEALTRRRGRRRPRPGLRATARPTARRARPSAAAASAAGYAPPTAAGGTSSARSCSTGCRASPPGCSSASGTCPTRWRCASR